MRLTSFSQDFTFGKVITAIPASKEDMLEGIDIWVGGIPIAWRRYRISIRNYGEISIRYHRSTGTPTEYDKMVGGTFKPPIYVFQWTDAVVICLTADIIAYLKTRRYYQKNNKDGLTSAIYIKIGDIRHLLIDGQKAKES